MPSALRKIRSLAIGKANTLQRAHAHLEQLAPAFADWAAGEIYVCRKTGQYRYRFGDLSKSVAPWDPLARSIFTTVEAFAFAALVLADKAPRLVKPAPAPVAQRVNVVALAA